MILNQNLSASAKKLKLGCRWILQQDNAPTNTTNPLKNGMNTKSSFCHCHPSRVLNLVENLRVELKKSLHKRRPGTLQDLETLGIEESLKIPPSVFSNLIRHYNRRLSVVGKRGLHKILNEGVPIIQIHIFLTFFLW